MKWIEIKGFIETDESQESMEQQFLEWLESKGWSFIGVTNEVEE